MSKMICCTSDEQTAVSKKIDAELRSERARIRNEVKLLLLGPGESGKSTVFKQLKIIQEDGGYTDEELSAYRFVVFGNCISQMRVLCQNAKKLQIEMELDANRANAERLIATKTVIESTWTPELAERIKRLWADKGIRVCYEQRDKHFQLNDSAAYFFENIDRYKDPNFLPTEEDVLRARVRTTGIEEAFFKFDELSFRLLDVGGQRNERRKWIHCFESVTAIIFCASLSEYDQSLREDHTQNRMKESLLLFDEVCNSPWFRETAFVLFLNKTDIFEEKIKKKDLTCCFPNYTGGCDYDKATEFIKQRYLELNTSPHHIYTHFTCAINTQGFKFVFRTVKKTLLTDIMNDLF